MIQLGALFYQRGWVSATSGNFSIRDKNHDGFWITRSGISKRNLNLEDFIFYSIPEQAVLYGSGKPSAETSIHNSIYKYQKSASAIVHGHTIEANAFQPIYPLLEGYQLHQLPLNELIKAYGIWEQNPKAMLPLFYNDINVPNISLSIDHYFLNHSNPIPSLLVVNHGVTSWGNSIEDALKCFEATEFLITLENRKSK